MPKILPVKSCSGFTEVSKTSTIFVDLSSKTDRPTLKENIIKLIAKSIKKTVPQANFMPYSALALAASAVSEVSLLSL